ncbi:pilus assembly protein [Pseudodesulfovibrio sp. JC047]|uniref:TadE/TadG family type IV pilus assembly protein n=1 Tax=Pseudodesulfovibrio sp. JC047 TaxID=2683199 RepID=UPI0013D7B303|nr:TadE/TadG family type IV pilus assembly protein [Pseudodesulfovibrio sp. JC047]NDV20692.1 pilus assembly protein [Pseudodesulfovibrio sp. JC047]
MGKKKQRQGMAAIEFALVLPVIALLLMLLVEGANAMHTYSSLVEASREGARHVLLEGNEANVEALVNALVADLDTRDLSTNVVMDPVAKTVTVEVSYDYQFFGFNNAGPSILDDESKTVQLIAQTTMPMP